MKYKVFKIKITDKCNRQCYFCIFNSNSCEMSSEQFKFIIDLLHNDKDIDFDKLHINGGEPLIHHSFVEMSQYAKELYPDKIFVLGTNAIPLDNNPELLSFVCKNYQEIVIGCDDEHQNIDILFRVIPRIRELSEDITIVINSVIEYTSQSTFKKIEELKDKYEIITVCNHICHIKKGLPINKLTRGVCKNKNSVLLIQENGDFYRCFNCSVPDDKEGNIFDKDFLLKVKKCNTGYYSYCPWCTHYE